ncbi:MAG: hypothetical protein JAY90_20480 [Candidatus Thiodiazotropha lotti]|nr:hypothetical protein [Candidatus Thiodiazotropha lotti]
MADSSRITSGTMSDGIDWNGVSENVALEPGNPTDNKVIGTSEQSMTTADRLLNSRTSADQLKGSLTTADILSGMQTITDRLADLDCLQDRTDLSKKITCDESLYENKNIGIQVGHGRFEYTPPNAKVDSEKLKASASVGIVTELTDFEGQIDMPVGQIGSIDARFKVGTINAHAKAEAKAEYNGFNFKNSGASLNASVGAEAMKWDVRYSTNANITPKSIGDTLSDIYNDYVDPVVDYVARRDVAEIPPLPSYLDHGIVLGGHITVGEGVSGKIGGSIDIGDGKIFNAKGRIKGGVGGVFGVGASIGLK